MLQGFLLPDFGALMNKEMNKLLTTLIDLFGGILMDDMGKI